MTKEPKMNSNTILVYGLDGKFIAAVNNWYEGKTLQKAALPKELHKYYGGLDTETGAPLFHTDIPERLAKRYNIQMLSAVQS